jgi:hypothetical protein
VSEPLAARNTDRELWRENPGDYYSPSIHVTEGGGIGFDVGGNVVVKPLREWHRLAASELAWKIMAKQEARYANLPTSEREASLQKALESTTADQIKAEDEVERLRLENGHLRDVLEQANDMCRSAYQIAERRGKNTAWPEFMAKLGAALSNQHQTLKVGKHDEKTA